MKRNITLLFCLIVTTLLSLNAQTTSYECDFEDDAENALWKMNVGAYGNDCINRWYIDTAQNNGGSRGLYISADGGKKANYKAATLLVASYRTIALPAGQYELQFDWTAGDNAGCYLSACLAPESVNIYSSPSGSQLNWVTDWALSFAGKTKLTCEMWNSASTIITTDGRPQNLIFAWINDLSTPLPPGACIDNINIVPLRDCDKPSDIAISSSSDEMTISWNGNADSYDIRYKIAPFGEWYELSGITQKYITISGLGEGVYDVYIRSNCGTKQSVWVSHNQFVFYAGTRCIDFLDLNDDNCYIGTFEKPKQRPLVVDSGYRSMYSRHTIHYNQSEYDPRTGHILKTVPNGEIASVRLGNWNWGHQGEAIVYHYHVDASTSAILLLRYAVVLENPDGHSINEQPRFTLSVTDNDGNPIENGCGDADFFAGFNTEDWNVVYPKGGDNNAKVLWKDWTTIGINLAAYDGQDLLIELNTLDCGQQNHYGYAYFTLNCSGGQLTGLSCGDDDKSRFQAPEGFKYRWYAKTDANKTTITEDRILAIDANDTKVYVCEVIQPTNTDCFYTLEAAATPRWPHSDAIYQIQTQDCATIVNFTNQSSVILVNIETKDTTYTNVMCESALWDFGDGEESDEWSPSHKYKNGGKYTVTLTSGIAGDRCQDSYSFEIDIPHLDNERDTTNATTCYGMPYKDKNGKLYYYSGVYSDTIVNSNTGCLRIQVLNLEMADKLGGKTSDTVCTGDLPYIFNDKKYYESGVYVDTLLSVGGCDSIVTIKLLVNSSLEVTFEDELWVCADEDSLTIPYQVQSGFFSSYSILFDNALNAPNDVLSATPQNQSMQIDISNEEVLPGNYAARFVIANADCGNLEKIVQLHISYPDSIIAQRWNDVLGVHNSQYNGSYTFSAYQWYKDGEKIEGAVGSNLYIAGGLETDVQYSVLLTRTNDGVKAYTCPVIPQFFQEVEDKPIVVFHSNIVSVSAQQACVMKIWSASGILVSEYDLLDGTSDIQLSLQSGMYLVEVVTNGGMRTIEKIMVTE